MSESPKNESMEAVISEYISRELVNKPDFNLKNDSLLFESGILESRSLLKLVLFLEQRFQIVVLAEEMLPENLKTVDVICAYLRSKKASKA